MTTPITIAQLSDLHLSDKPSRQRFLEVLAFTLTKQPNFLLLTGDLVNDGQQMGYDWLFDVLDDTKLPYACVAGNHDVNHQGEHWHHLTPSLCHPSLRGMGHYGLAHWQLLTLNSSVGGAIGGFLDQHSLHFITQILTHDPRPAIIALHHHPTAVGSAWIDAHLLANGRQLEKLLDTFDHVKAVVCGHVHQAHTLPFGRTLLYTCPAVSRQFLPFVDDFAIDTLPAGFRLFRLYDITFDTAVHRLWGADQ